MAGKFGTQLFTMQMALSELVILLEEKPNKTMKLKNLLIALLMTIGTALMAQDKYEQAVVRYNLGTLFISIEGKEYKKIKLDKKDFADSDDLSFVLKELASMRYDGWEVWNVNSVKDGAFTTTTYFLHRKLK